MATIEERPRKQASPAKQIAVKEERKWQASSPTKRPGPALNQSESGQARSARRVPPKALPGQPAQRSNFNLPLSKNTVSPLRPGTSQPKTSSSAALVTPNKAALSAAQRGVGSTVKKQITPANKQRAALSSRADHLLDSAQPTARHRNDCIIEEMKDAEVKSDQFSEEPRTGPRINPPESLSR